ncbi:MAG: hydantoinase B/oxoprolinase family protein [Candidatus Binatia bacterium]
MSQTEIHWDGRTYPYVPGKELRIDGALKLHTHAVEKIDPITYEVIRHALWNINVEHGNTIMRISGSPSCAYGHDFNPSLMDENGDFVFFGPFLQYLSSATGSAVKWTLEHRSENPGISEGDIFLTNDPWIGATHQSDVALVAPVFWEGALFCWVGNTLHQWDMGGTAPGGFNPMAADVFWESGCIPPIKIVEGGKLRKDLEEEYSRRSRMPQLVALDLRAEIAGCNVARERLLTLTARYGAATVKGVMRKLQDDSEKAFLCRLETIPDGTWRESSWIELKGPGDRHLYRNSLSLTTRGDRLIFSNEGSDPQAGTLNCTLVAWKGAVASMICSQMLFDQMFVVEGAYRHMEFEVVPGTISCATFPAAVSAAPPGVLLQTIALSGLVISKMLACSSDPQMRSEVQSCMGAAMYPVCAFNGIDQRGAPYASFLLDPVGAALAGSPWRDGVDTGGWPWDLQSTMPNVEDNEWFYPILYLWRKELVNSGGAGKYRGGNSGELAFIPHGTERISLFTASGYCAVPGPGLHGGLSPATTRFSMKRDANVTAQIRTTGQIPTSVDEMQGKLVYIAPKAFDVTQTPQDVFLLSWAGAGGYGDPLERDPARVALDVQRGNVSREWAHEAYGVLLKDDGSADLEATDARRTKLRKARLRKAPKRERHKVDTVHARRIAEGLILSGGTLACSKCERAICSMTDNYKLHCATIEQSFTKVNPYLLNPKTYVDDKMAFRSYACPSCGLLLQTEITRPTDPPLWDIQLAG